MSDPLSIIVRGLPIAQGNSRAFVAQSKGGKFRAIVTTEANRTNSPLGAWRSAIATEARDEMGNRPLFEGALRVTVTFCFPRPKSHFLPATKSRPTPILRDDAPVFHTSRPDVDKLTRALFDALTNVVWHDDAQVADVRARKVYGLYPGATITVETPLP